MTESLLLIMGCLAGATFVAVLMRRLHPLSFPPVVASAFAFFYVWQPGFMIREGYLRYFLDEGQVAKALYVPICAFIAFSIGWLRGGRLRPRTGRAAAWNYDRMYWLGIALSMAGLALFLGFVLQSGGVTTYYSVPHGVAGRWLEQTAWVYMGDRWTFPGIALMAVSLAKGRLPMRRWLPFGVIILVMMTHAILSSSRGTLFPIVAGTAVALYLSFRKTPSFTTLIVGGFATGIAVLLLVGYREALTLAKDRPDVELADALLLTSGVTDSARGAHSAGNEFLFHAALVDGADRLDSYALGRDWLFRIFVHPVPRLLWPEKPTIAWGVTVDDLAGLNGWRIAEGAAPAAVADFHREFGLLALLAWCLVGTGSRALFERARSGSPTAIVSYALWWCWSLNFLAQGPSAIIVLALYTLVPALVALRLCRTPDRGSTGAANRTGQLLIAGPIAHGAVSPRVPRGHT